MKVTFSLDKYRQEFFVPYILKTNKVRLLSASIYNFDMITDNQPLYINIDGMNQNYDFNSNKYYTSILYPHSADSWYLYSRDLDNYDYQANMNNGNMTQHITIQIDFKTELDNLGLNKVNLEFEFL